MGVQFGRWNLDGGPSSPDYLEKVQEALSSYAPDGTSSYRMPGVSIFYGALHTTNDSRGETQPHVSPSGTVITWDGRLDNRAELLHQLSDRLPRTSPDVRIVARAYERWKKGCFAKLIGDWAVSIWEPRERSLILAKDPIGIRHLFYSVNNKFVTWSTILDPLVVYAGRSFSLEEEYLAGWLSFFPATHLSPYAGIHSVPPSCFVSVNGETSTVGKYWDFDPANRILYHSDAEYEEHFRDVMSESLRRRLRADSPVIAELSGGMDSSSIVCMADAIIAKGLAQTPRLATVSYYSDSEPNWNERPYFTSIEKTRGRTGRHIDVSSNESFMFPFEATRFAATPGSSTAPTEVTRQLIDCFKSEGSRVLLSGIGGDEVTGGMPTPGPELADLMVGARFKELASQLTLWALDKRKPWLHLLFDAGRGFLPIVHIRTPKYRRPASWLRTEFLERNREALQGYESRLSLFGPRPSFQENLSTLDALRRQLACSMVPPGFPYEKRYPYLDRTLLEFLFAVPSQQLVRPGQRRSLMRRALAGIVPDEVVNRKRKASLARGPLEAISEASTRLAKLGRQMTSDALGVVNEGAFYAAAQSARDGQTGSIIPLIRTLGIESWLNHLSEIGIPTISVHIER
jgi:asparagine synthase (glutamine-hydrolysing)